MDYYHSLDFSGELIFCDASDDTATYDLVVSAAKRKRHLIKYRHSASRPWESVAECVHLSSSDFAALTCDDDYLVPTTIEKCITFLAQNPAYSSAHGKAIIAESRSSINRIDAVGNYCLPVRPEVTGSLRIVNLGGEYSVNLFAVHCAPIFRRMCDASAKFDPEFVCADWELSGEILPNLISSVYGKSFELSDLYLVRHIHSGRYQSPKSSRWMASPGWRSDYTYCIKKLGAAIAQVDGCAESVAEDTARTSLERYLVGVRRNESSANVARLRVLSAMKLILELLGLGGIVRRIRSALFPKPLDEQITLDGILDFRHPYHQEFLPVLRSFGSVVVP